MNAHPTVPEVRRQSVLAPVAVGAQVVLLAALAWPARRSGAVLFVWTGRALSATGVLAAGAAAAELGPALTPSPVPRSSTRLRRDGLFTYVRHPIYSGLFLFAAGRVLTAGRRRVLPAVALGVLLQVKARWEERLLSARFRDYPSYASTTGRFIPARGSGGR